MEMFRVILLQAAATVLASFVGGVVAGLRGGISSALGGAVCVLPNLFLALYLKFSTRRPGVRFVFGFMFSEAVKLVLVVGLLFVAVRRPDDIHMPSLLIGLVLTTQSLFFLGFWKKN